VSSRCAVCTALQKDLEEGEGHEWQGERYNPEGFTFTFTAQIRYTCLYRGTDHVPPLIQVTPSIFLMTFVP
jgi:hypothetical protein